MNELRSLAITADFLNLNNVREIQKILLAKSCSGVSFFLHMPENNLQDLKKNIDSSNLSVEFFTANYARERSLNKLRSTIQRKRTECDDFQKVDFSEDEVLEIFSSSSELLHYDLIILADSSRDSLANNFITDASYAEIYMSRSIFSEENFDIMELEAAIELYEGIQRNFGS